MTKWLSTLTILFSVGIAFTGCTPINQSPSQPIDVAAYYWPAYHNGPRWRQFYKGTEGEWEIVRNAKQHVPGQYQPRVPLWGYQDESDPRVMAKKIDTAVSHGVNVFIFDWYWYDNKPFLEDAIDKGFLKAPNNRKIKFYIMWANHDATTLWDLERSHKMETIWPGAVDRATFDTITDRIIAQYMKHSSYYKIDGKPVFSIYELNTLIKGLGGIEQTKQALDSFREKVIKAGFPGLHLQAVLKRNNIPKTKSADFVNSSVSQDNTLKYLDFDSLTLYQWCTQRPAKGKYLDWAECSTQDYPKYDEQFSIPYIPHVSIGFDTNPRFKEYWPYTILNPSPEVFEQSLRKAKAFLNQHPDQPKLITVNSWNEWSEGSYLEPDKKFGYAYLNAVKNVFKN